MIGNPRMTICVTIQHPGAPSICSFGVFKGIHPEQNAPTSFDPATEVPFWCPQDVRALCEWIPARPPGPLGRFPQCLGNENVQLSQPRTCKAVWKCSFISELLVPPTPAAVSVDADGKELVPEHVFLRLQSRKMTIS